MISAGISLIRLKRRMELKDYNQSRLEFMYMIKTACETSKHLSIHHRDIKTKKHLLAPRYYQNNITTQYLRLKLPIMSRRSAVQYVLNH